MDQQNSSNRKRPRVEIETTEDAIAVPSEDNKEQPTTPASASVAPALSIRGRPNSELTEEEKEAKRRLKKRIKLQYKIKTLRTKIRHSQRRKDVRAEENARKDLAALYAKEKEAIQEMNFDKGENEQEESSNSYSNQIRVLKEQASPLILEVSIVLFQQAAESALVEGNTSREAQNSNAVKLLKHMTKGTQNPKMFQDSDALWGYTRQKFNERALLLCSSLGRIRPSSQGIGDDEDENNCGAQCDNNDAIMLKQKLILKRAWDIISENGVRKACSIGCGPGNDAVGLISFLRMILGTKTKILDDILLVDWSINEWKSAVIDPLKDILLHGNLVREGGVKTLFGDVTKDLEDEANASLKAHLCMPDHNGVDGECTSDYDMYLISYLLSETRGKWESFFESLVKNSKAGSMFYFAEPIPWQLHRFIDIFEDYLDFVWVDSSMEHPGLQGAERRAGPAILFAIRR